MTTSQDMMQVQRDLGRILEAIANGEIHRKEMSERIDKLSDRIDGTNEKIDALSSSTGKMDQSLQSLSKITNQIALEKCGERLDRLETALPTDCLSRLAAVEKIVAPLPELLLWRKVVGTGAWAIVRVVGTLVGSGALGALLVSYVKSKLHF